MTKILFIISREGEIISLVIFMLFFSSEVFSQSKQIKPTRQSAIEAFSKENFEEASRQFNELSVSFPKDPIYKYYCGVCLIRLNREPGKASSLIQEALQNSSAVRAIPADGLFYLGRARQMSGKFNEAIKSYNIYANQVGKKIARELGIPELIRQCNEGKGQIAEAMINGEKIIKENSSKITPDVTVQEVMKPGLQPDDVILKTELPGNYERLLSEALDFQFKADSLNGIASDLRQNLGEINNSGKTALKARVTSIEKLASDYQIMADRKLAEARNLSLISKAEKPISTEMKNRSDSITLNASNIKPAVIEPEPGSMKDTIRIARGEKQQIVIGQKTDNHLFKDFVNRTVSMKEKIPSSVKTAQIFSVFEVVTKPVYAPDKKVDINPAVPQGLIYRIQVAVFRNPVAPSYFKGITPVHGFKAEDSELTTYYAGMFRKSADAAKALLKVKTLGFKDAFVAALSEKKIISAERAKLLEREWGNVPFVLSNDVNAPTDTVPPTLIFRVEVAKSPKPLKADQLDNIKKIAGSRGLDIFTNDSGQNIYLIGKFLTFESAEEYASLLIRNGLRDSKAVAYLGKKEIPVETAKQLFEKY